MTLGIEVGVHNVTLAIFITLTVLNSLPLAVTQNIYGIVMLFDAALLIRWYRGRIAERGKSGGVTLHEPAGDQRARKWPSISATRTASR